MPQMKYANILLASIKHIKYCLCDVTLSVYPHRAGLKRKLFFKPARCGYTLRVTSHKHLIHLSTLHQHSKFHDY